MANMNNDSDRRIRDLNMQIQDERRRKVMGCMHNDPRKGVWLTPLSESDKFKKSGQFNVKQYPPDSVICDGPNGCGAIFSTLVYNQEEVTALQFQAYSMVQQVKLLAKLDETTADEVEYIEKLLSDQIATFCQFYNKMADTLVKGQDKQNKGNNGPSKGGFGVPKTYNRQV